MAALLKLGLFRNYLLLTAFQLKKIQINFRDLSENELGSLTLGIFDKLTSLGTL